MQWKTHDGQTIDGTFGEYMEYQKVFGFKPEKPADDSKNITEFKSEAKPETKVNAAEEPSPKDAYTEAEERLVVELHVDGTSHDTIYDLLHFLNSRGHISDILHGRTHNAKATLAYFRQLVKDHPEYHKSLSGKRFKNPGQYSPKHSKKKRAEPSVSYSGASNRNRRKYSQKDAVIAIFLVKVLGLTYGEAADKSGLTRDQIDKLMSPGSRSTANKLELRLMKLIGELLK